jgi:hypothetical protein
MSLPYQVVQPYQPCGMMGGMAEATEVTQVAMTGWRRVGAVTLVVLGCLTAVAGTLTVIAGAFTISFDAIAAVGTASGMNREIAWMLPVSVDGAMAVATVVAILLRQAGRPTLYPWLVVAAGVAMSMACNAAHAQPVVGDAEPAPLELDPIVAALVSTIPALTLALSVHLLMTLALAVLSPVTGDNSGVSPVTGDKEPAVSDMAPPATRVADSPQHEVVTVPVTAPVSVVAPTDSAPALSPRHLRPSSPDMTTARDTRARGVAMAAEGATAEQIMTALNVSERTAYRYVSAARRQAG